MELHPTPQQEAHLHQLATRTGKDAERLAREAVDRMPENDTNFRAAVREGFAAIDRGDFIDEEEMDARVSRMLRN